jgi:hypothetical protein
MRKILIITLIAFSMTALAQTPILVDPQSGKYLGNYSANQYDPNSISNPYGKYGSRYSPDSVNNPYGKYGSQYSPNSAHNPYAINPPKIVYPGR